VTGPAQPRRGTIRLRAGRVGALGMLGFAALVACGSVPSGPTSPPTGTAAALAPMTAARPGPVGASPAWSVSPTPVGSTGRPSRPAAPASSRAVVPRAPATFRFPVPVSVGNARQVITVRAHGSYASVEAWQLVGSSWQLVVATTAARVGANGVVPAASRTQGTDTTPEGTFTLTQAFGIQPDPGTRMPYHQVTPDDWWVEDNLSAYYNQMRTASQGGFDTSLPETATNGSEHLITHTVTYQYAVVIDFNRWPAVRYRGAGIFLHVNGTGATAGCVSVPLATMVTVLRWLDPSMHPRIAIA
jgi:L,D-peptidoglycan transpeptidase YkuD (ErfK/YbiS/YcfS/YnhG family)